MSVRVSCPGCRLALLVSGEHLGKLVRCPGCQQAFAVRPPCLRLGWATSPGRVRSRNEDSLLVQELRWACPQGPHELALLAVADGMGGHHSGERASALAVASLAAALAPRILALLGGNEPPADAPALLEALDLALWEANRNISRAASTDSGCAGMGATAVVALVLDGRTAICHVGDCRAYHRHAGQLRCLTRDQTLARRMVELGQLTEAEASRHPSASQVAQALGRQFDLEPSRQTLDLAAGDWLVLACDGLHAHVDERALAEMLAAADEPQRLADTLIDAANAGGGSDNCTVIVARRT